MSAGALELWGGLECTVTRIGETWRDQFRDTGHWDRPEDLDAIAGLGIRRLRFPVLLEQVAPHRPDLRNWSWHDVRIDRMRRLGIEPIVGFLHHSGGPRYTSLVDPDLPGLVAAHAQAVARRWPDLRDFTPVNEPLTTARFAGLYGHWHPHGRDYATFLRALVVQCRAVLDAMRSIREITPDARLVQTEDLGRVFGTPETAEQVAHENERRWLSFDLLCGRVDRAHPFHRILLDHGIAEAELTPFRSGDARPDIVGVNHYLTSDRFLDHRLDRYPPATHGGNGRQRYADVEAARVDLDARAIGAEARLWEAWERYRLPLAVTEAHLGCTREDQLRWLAEVWNAAAAVRARGADLRAVTVWSMLGAVDWNSLLTRRDGHYECGAFDIRSDPPRPTALAKAAQALAMTGRFDHPILDGPGWWRRPERLFEPRAASRCGAVRQKGRRLLIVGAAGRLGRTLVRACAQRGLACVALAREQLDIADAETLRDVLDSLRPWAVLNAVARDPADVVRAEAYRAIVEGAVALARACAERRIRQVAFSPDLVFAGRATSAYVESDPTGPACAYGALKVAAEHHVLDSAENALLVRCAPFFAPWEPSGRMPTLLRALRSGGVVTASEAPATATYLPDLVNAALDLLIDEAAGIWHLATDPAGSWRDVAAKLAVAAGLDAGRVETADAAYAPVRLLTSERSKSLLPSLDSAIDRFVREAGPWSASVDDDADPPMRDLSGQVAATLMRGRPALAVPAEEVH